MKIMRKRNKNGFTYVVAIGILGLLAFMGIFLMQSSSAEYSQTSMSVYRTMGRQLAEAAADEAVVQLEELLKNKGDDGFFKALIQQAATSGPSREIKGKRGKTGLLTSFGNDFNDLKNYVTQTNQLINLHVTRAGFTVDKVLPTIKDLRPIPQEVLDDLDNYYRPTDRDKGFDYINEELNYSRDWYGTLQIDVTLSLNKKPKATFNYQIRKDFKLLNLGPTARNYSYYSILGILINHNLPMASLNNEMGNQLSTLEKGRLFLWNLPFQSRVFLHGPAVIELENPNYELDTQYKGGYKIPDDLEGPGANLAFQYSDTFFGFSYLIDTRRCIFPQKHFWEWFTSKYEDKGDSESLGALYSPFISKATYIGGTLADRSAGFLDKLSGLVTNGYTDNFYVGRAVHQKFLPAGPFCRTPWRYVAPTPEASSPSWNNIKSAENLTFPKTDNRIRLEHRWDPEDDSVEKNTNIFCGVFALKYKNKLIGEETISVNQNIKYDDFSLTYYNEEEADTFLEKLGGALTSFGKNVFHAVASPFEMGFSLIQDAFSHFKADENPTEVTVEKQNRNLYPTNYKFKCKRMATRRLKDENCIPRDEEGNWILNGVYWMESLKITGDVTYVGTGTLFVENCPVVISGNVMAYRGPNDDGPPQGHLNIFYHPVQSYNGSGFYSEVNNVNYSALEKRMLIIENGSCVEASIYSLCGIKSKNGLNIPLEDFVDKYNMNPKDFWVKDGPWDHSIIKVKEGGANMVYGNYVNYFAMLNQQDDDLWVVHHDSNSFYCEPSEMGGVVLVQDLLDTDDNKRLEYEMKSHEFFMSPKIQSVGIKRGS